MRASNIGKVRACGPSDNASLGSGWISTMMPWAPLDKAARAIGGMNCLTPTACEGSTMMGRWERSRTTGTAERSRVLRVAVSNVRMPRSQRMTFWLPWARMYSAAFSHSSMDDIIPRFNITGR